MTNNVGCGHRCCFPEGVHPARRRAGSTYHTCPTQGDESDYVHDYTHASNAGFPFGFYWVLLRSHSRKSCNPVRHLGVAVWRSVAERALSRNASEAKTTIERTAVVQRRNRLRNETTATYFSSPHVHSQSMAITILLQCLYSPCTGPGQYVRCTCTPEPLR